MKVKTGMVDHFNIYHIPNTVHYNFRLLETAPLLQSMITHMLKIFFGTNVLCILVYRQLLTILLASNQKAITNAGVKCFVQG